MMRTIKFQSSNFLKMLFYGALCIYAALAIFFFIFFIIDSNMLSDRMTQLGGWIGMLYPILTPIIFVSFAYPAWEGVLYFDSALRFGLARRGYIGVQLVIYFLLAVISSFIDGLQEVEFSGTAMAHFTEISQEYLSFSYILNEFSIILLIAIISLAFYRFHMKVFLPALGLIALVAITAGLIGLNILPIASLQHVLIPFLNFIMQQQNVILLIFQIGLVFIYALFVSKIELQN